MNSDHVASAASGDAPMRPTPEAQPPGGPIAPGATTVTSSTGAGRDSASNTVGIINAQTVNLGASNSPTSLLTDFVALCEVLGKRLAPVAGSWKEPSTPIDLGPPIEVEGVVPDLAADRFRAQRVLIVECIDSKLQRGVTAAVVGAVELKIKTVLGVIDDEERADGGDGTTAGDDRERWGLQDLRHPELAGGGPCVIVLALEGARGSAYLDACFASPGRMRTLATALAQANRYLVLWLRGRTGTPAIREQLLCGLDVQRLKIEFLGPLLRRRFPRSAPQLEAAVSAQIANGCWGDRGQLYEWLCEAPDGEPGELRVQQGPEGGVGEPQPIKSIAAALDRTDAADERLLTAVFVAAYLPGLAESDFARAVEALLGDRTRVQALGPATQTGSEVPPQPIEIGLASEWRSTIRRVMRDADLELRTTASSPRTVCFRADGALARVKALLDRAPMFVATQLDYLRHAGLLFDRSHAISRAVIDLVSAVAAEDPDQLDAGWMLGLVIGIRRDTRDVPNTPETSEHHEAEWVPRHLTCAHGLLRRLIDAARDKRPRGGLTTVHGVLERMLRLGGRSAVHGLELAYRLRNAPGFDVWYWIRQAVERGREAPRAHAATLADRLIRDQAESQASLAMLFEWLPGDGQTAGSGAATLAAIAIADCLAECFACAPGDDPTQLPTLTSLLRDEADRGDHPQLAQIVTACFHPLVAKHLERKLGGLDAWLATLLLPDRSQRSDGESELRLNLQHLGSTWGELIGELQKDFEEHALASRLPAALILASWGHAHANRPIVAQALARTVREQFASTRLEIQAWLGTFDEVMSRCEDLVVADAKLTDERRSQWIRASIRKRRTFVELCRWLAQGLPDPPRAEASS